MANNEEVFFDGRPDAASAAGISIEEQKEIISAINGIAEKNRERLSRKAGGEQGSKTQIKAKKSGAFFPLVVNIGAAVILCAGAFLLISFNGKTDAQVRTGNAVFNLTEKALIDDIRKDTAEKIAVKETEIFSIASRLEEVDVQLALLQSSNQELTSEQLETRQRLLFLQNSYREELALLQDERSRILESSRSREAFLRAQLDERAREYSSYQQRTSTELDSAMRELERLSGEQEKIAALDAQVAGALSSVRGLIKNGKYAQAADAVSQLRNYLSGNSAASTRSFQQRRDYYFQSIDFAETMISLISADGALGNMSGGQEQTELTEKNALLEQTIAGLQKTIDALSSGSSGQAARLKELEETVSTLRFSVSSLESSSAEKDRTILSLENERASLTRTNQTQEQEITNLRNQINIIRDLLEN